jgi:murein DD-endopeptidase MepM/ murein hydrolase activator NlpD
LRFGYIRAIAYGAVVIGTAIALTYIPALPDSRPAEVLFSQAAAPAWKLRYDTLESGGTLARLLKRGGLTDSAVIAAIRASSAVVNPRQQPAGMQVEIRTAAADSTPSEVVLQLTGDKLVRLTRDGTEWTGAEEKIPWVSDTIVVAGTIQSNLYDAVDAVAESFLPRGARIQLANVMADNVYSYKIDMNRELQKGDEFKVLAVRETSPTGNVRITDVLASTFSLSGSVMKAIHFVSKTGGEYFDDQGRSMKAMFSKNPVKFSRISSTFGSRRHPILGYTRAHKGTDYAANEGTPVQSIGDGVVISAGWNSGFGNLIQIRHPNGYVTRYGHLSKILVHRGQRVKIDETIGRVGHTGLATGPHLHFEVMVNGVQRNSLTAFKASSGAPIAKTETDTFARLRDALLAKLEAAGSNSATTLASLTDRLPSH